MNNWEVVFLPQAEADRKALDGSIRKQVDRAILKVSENPLPISEGGYGKHLGNKNGHNLSGLLKIKLKDSGIRIIYQLIKTERGMNIIIVGARADSEVYKQDEKRLELK